MEGIIIKEIQGKFIKYIKIIAETGYCFYNKTFEDIYYMTDLTAPLSELANIDNYVAVWGDADELNAKLEEERQKAVEDDGSGI